MQTVRRPLSPTEADPPLWGPATYFNKASRALCGLLEFENHCLQLGGYKHNRLPGIACMELIKMKYLERTCSILESKFLFMTFEQEKKKKIKEENSLAK